MSTITRPLSHVMRACEQTKAYRGNYSSTLISKSTGRANRKWVEVFKKIKLPRAKSTSCAETATAEPLHDPPGTADGEAGLIGVPQCKFSPVTL